MHAPSHIIKWPGVNVSLWPGRKWTQWSAQLDVTDLLTLTTGVGQGRHSFVSNTNNSDTLKTPEQCPCTLPAVSLLFHHVQKCQMFSGLVICVSPSLSSTAAGSSSHCSLVDACWFSGASGLLFRLQVSALDMTTFKCCVVSVWVSVCLHFFFLSEFVYLCAFDACVCGSALSLYG